MAAREWVSNKCNDLEAMLLEHGGLIKISNFLPETLAEDIYHTLKCLPEVQRQHSVPKSTNYELTCRTFGSLQKQVLMLHKIILIIGMNFSR